MEAGMKAIVLFDSLFGNTKKIAKTIADGLRETRIEAECVNIKDAKGEKPPEYDLLAIGAPAQILTASKPIKEFLEKLEGVDLKGKAGFAFDTKIDSRFTCKAGLY